ATIVEADPGSSVAVILSACRGVTDALLALVASAERQDPQVAAQVDALERRHTELASELLAGSEVRDYLAELEADCHDIRGILQTVRLTRATSPALRDLVAGFGELWSSRLFARYLRHRGHRTGRIEWIDARDVIQVDWGALGPNVRWPETRDNAARLGLIEPSATRIIPGFVARDQHGVQTTLGRNGSDFSASIFGQLLNAGEIHIWTDVDGVLSADPRLVPDATVIDSLSYHEAMELAYFGAQVIHPQTMAPAVVKGIPIWIRNTFAPDHAGTLICGRPTSNHLVKGITSIDRVALINVEGAGMIGVPGTAQRLFLALREHGISVILISQGSSEHSICFAVPMSEAVRAEQVVRKAFRSELTHGQIQSVDVAPDCSILAVVGDGMAGTPGVAAKLFSALGNAGVNVRAIAQGASERNISLVIDAKQATRALRSVHSSFYLSPHTVSIGLIGPGAVGSEFIDQLASQRERFQRDSNLDLRLRGIMTSTQMLLGEPTVACDDWRQALARGQPADLSRFEEHIHADHLPHAVIVDCTASGDVAGRYPGWLAAGIHVVTPNKRANSADMTFYARLMAARREGSSHYLYEATVGAGLPVIQTIRDLRETGDDIQRVEGILSGTLSYLFNVWDGREPFSDVVRDARRKGYTEPDPRDDLSGMDVARKLVILGREMGLGLALEDVEVETLVPDSLAGGTAEEFLDGLGTLDAKMLARLQSAQANGRVLRYVGALNAATQRATVGLVELDHVHPFANINLTDNVVRFITGRYDQNPLVVQGPGAGPAVTAAGVFADLLRVCAYLGARL
ncbi:MAG: bifunctional aspartate kinase/homoserine dehydrogenase I, partial [Acidobacteria bacterium]|nr:bifunctional aspartate kinase/homoserine dehydrogenase I [Acidobacteriota bacterium]